MLRPLKKKAKYSVENIEKSSKIWKGKKNMNLDFFEFLHFMRAKNYIRNKFRVHEIAKNRQFQNF